MKRFAIYLAITGTFTNGDSTGSKKKSSKKKIVQLKSLIQVLEKL